MRDQNDCERIEIYGNELALGSSFNDPTSCFFIEEERVNLAELVGFANPSPPLPREEVVVDLATRDNAVPEFSAVSRNGADDEGCIARGIPLGCSTLGVWISGS